MKLSKRGEYGLRTMIFLAVHQVEQPMYQIKEIAHSEQIPIKYLEQIMLSLRNAGLLQSKRGVSGGYYLARTPAEISLSEIIRVLDGPLAPIRCVSQMAYEPCGCPDEATCGLRLTMQEVRDELARMLDNTSLQDVIEKVQASQVNTSIP